jgi:hypothetical protein
MDGMPNSEAGEVEDDIDIPEQNSHSLLVTNIRYRQFDIFP